MNTTPFYTLYYDYTAKTKRSFSRCYGHLSCICSQVSHGCSAFAILDHQFLEAECRISMCMRFVHHNHEGIIEPSEQMQLK